MQPGSCYQSSLLGLPDLHKLRGPNAPNSMTWLPKFVNCLPESQYKECRRTYGIFIPVDPVHGPITLGPLAAMFHRTPAVQRLRHLHQLGASHYVFPGAVHDRLSHSVGVAYLAWQLGNNLRLRGARISFWDLELLEVAGLLHDLGHGAFSHVFEHLFLKEMGTTDWHHEAMSLKLLDYTVKQHNIPLDYESICKIKDMISGADLGSSKTHWTGWSGDDQWKLQIVANVTNGIDVDKLDYLMRDALSVGVCCDDHTVIHGLRKILDHCKVVNAEICYSEAVQDDVANLYHLRAYMHHNVYQHPAVKGAEYMVVAALKLADQVMQISSKIHSADDYLTLDDRIPTLIMNRAAANPYDAQLQAAAAVLRRLEVQDLFKCVAEAEVPQQVLQQGYKCLEASDVVSDHNRPSAGSMSVSGGVRLESSDVAVHNAKVTYCRGLDNPLQCVHLYSSDNSGQLRPADVGYNNNPAAFMVRKERVYLTKVFSNSSDETAAISAIAAAFTSVMRDKCGPDVVITYFGSADTAETTDNPSDAKPDLSAAQGIESTNPGGYGDGALSQVWIESQLDSTEPPESWLQLQQQHSMQPQHTRQQDHTQQELMQRQQQQRSKQQQSTKQLSIEQSFARQQCVQPHPLLVPQVCGLVSRNDREDDDDIVLTSQRSFQSEVLLPALVPSHLNPEAPRKKRKVASAIDLA